MNASIASNEEAQSRPPQLKMNSGQAVRQPLWLAYVLAVVSTVATIILALVLDSGALNRPTFSEFSVADSPLVNGLLTEPFRLDADGRLAIPTGPGLGVELNEDIVDKMRVG